MGNSMTQAPVDLNDRLIAFSADKTAVPIAARLARGSAAAGGCMMGITDITDDESVHADHWEIHPDRDEIPCVLERRLVATVERRGVPQTPVTLERGQAFIVPRASWHRLQVLEPGRLLFFSPCAGSDLRRT